MGKAAAATMRAPHAGDNICLAILSKCARNPAVYPPKLRVGRMSVRGRGIKQVLRRVPRSRC